MTILLTLHILGIGIWIGVVGAEFAIEFDGMKDEKSLVRAAELHYKTDIWIEVPAFLTVLLTGLAMLRQEHLVGLFLIKVVFAVLAILFNMVCVYAVFKRRSSLREADAEGIRSAGMAMKLGGLIIPTFLVAFSLGIYFAAT